jgi:hypothetical protein
MQGRPSCLLLARQECWLFRRADSDAFIPAAAGAAAAHPATADATTTPSARPATAGADATTSDADTDGATAPASPGASRGGRGARVSRAGDSRAPAGAPQDRLARVRAALRAAADRPAAPLVRTAFRAAAERAAAPLRRALVRACLASDLRDAADRPSRLSALRMASDRLADGRFCGLRRPVLRRLFAAAFPFLGILTPALRALDRPIAIACFVDRAPCLPSRTWCISSRTNSPACVDGDFPARLSSRARSIVSCSGITTSS